MKRFAGSNTASIVLAQGGLWVALLALIVVFANVSPYFLSVGNFKNILLQMSIVGILAVGQTFVIVSGGIDLSVGAIVALGGVLGADVLSHGGGWALGFIVPIAVGAAVGLANGVLVGRFRLQPFIVTFASLYVVSGLALAKNNAQPIAISNSTFNAIGANSLAGVPILVVFFVAIIVVAYLWQAWTPRGRHVFAIGANAEAARQHGIPVRRLTVGVYLVNGMLAGLAAALLDAWTATGEPTGGTGYELTAIAAVVIGGTSLLGGEGGLQHTIVGILLIGVINNGLNLAGVSSYTQQIVTGLIIVAAVLFDRWRRRRSRAGFRAQRIGPELLGQAEKPALQNGAQGSGRTVTESSTPRADASW
jgi:putative xylitol transport system permease protein